MIKRLLKLIVFSLFIISGAFLWIGRKPSSANLKWGELDSQGPLFNSRAGVLIIFNSGGWGNTAFEEAEDFGKVIRGIRAILNKLRWETAIISYGRTADNFWGRLRGLKEIFTSFRSQSKKLANQINIFLNNNPKVRVLMAGLSLGADFTGETAKKIGKTDRVAAIKAGTPFWADSQKSENILELANEKDLLVTGDYKTLVSLALRGAIRWVTAKIKQRKLFFSEAMHFPGHRYDWRSTWFRKQINSFLENNFKIM